MTDSPALRVADLPQTRPTPFALQPDAAALEALKTELDLLGLKKLRFTGEIQTVGKRDWKLTGLLGATVTQPCVVSLEPVTTRIDLPVERTYVAGLTYSEEEEAEMPEDDTQEPLGAFIDPQAVMIEALSLALPQYPRKDGAHLTDTTFAEPGVQPMQDEDTRPFAGLAALRDQLKK